MQRAGDVRRRHAVSEGEWTQLGEWWGNEEIADEFEAANSTVKTEDLLPDMSDPSDYTAVS